MTFRSDNRAFESWLRDQCRVVETDLRLKHRRMRLNPFVFLRATYFRWARRIEAICPALAEAPAVLGVGDLHLENFGTWRDAEGRLVWGVNDFDEASVMPYAFDLVRLAASIRLAPRLKVSNRAVAKAILRGYASGLAEPRPMLLDEQESWMRPYVACMDKDLRKFWDEIDALERHRPPSAVARGLSLALPRDAGRPVFAMRARGGGSLGRPRFVAIASWKGGRVVREAKALVPSAWDWAHGRSGGRLRFIELARGRYRSPDPFLMVRDRFLFRRIAADSRKVELGFAAAAGMTRDLFEAMGFDLGAIHGASPRVAAVRADLARRSPDWLYRAARDAAADVLSDFEEWST